MDQILKAKILSYLKAIRFVPQDCKNTNLRWSSLNGVQNVRAPVIHPIFIVKWGPASNQISNESVKMTIGSEEVEKHNMKCTSAIVCQEIK